jgi:hypothetical protein
VLDVVGAQGLQSYLKGALGAARAEAAAAPPPSGDAHRVRVLRAEGFASDVKALSKRVQDEGVRPEFARFFVTKKQADELGRPSLETSHMPCDPGAHRAGHRCTKDCLLRLMVFQEDWLAHAAPVAERLAAARGVPRRDVAAAEGRRVGRAGPARGAALTEAQRSTARNRDLKLEDELECADMSAADGGGAGSSGWAFAPSFEPADESEYLSHTWRAAMQSTEAFTRAMAVEMLADGFVPGGSVCRWCIKTVLCVGDSYLWGDKKPDRMTRWACEAAGVPVDSAPAAIADSIPRMSARNVARLDASTGQECRVCEKRHAGQPRCEHLRVDAKLVDYWRGRWDQCAQEPSVFKVEIVSDDSF